MSKIFNSSLVIVITAAIVIGNAAIYLSDKGIGGNNTFANNPLDLQVKDQNEPWGNGVSATWVMDNMKPGDTSEMNSVYLRNVSSTEADYVKITVANITTDPNNEESDTEYPTDDNMDKWMEIAEMYYNGNNILTDLTDQNGNGWRDLDDFEQQGLENLTPPLADLGNMKIFTLQLKFRQEADNMFQGDILESEFTFWLIQDK